MALVTVPQVLAKEPRASLQFTIGLPGSLAVLSQSAKIATCAFHSPCTTLRVLATTSGCMPLSFSRALRWSSTDDAPDTLKHAMEHARTNFTIATSFLSLTDN